MIAWFMASLGCYSHVIIYVKQAGRWISYILISEVEGYDKTIKSLKQFFSTI